MDAPHERHTKEVEAKRRPPRAAGPVAQGPAVMMEEADALLLQRAVADPVVAAPAHILALQRRYGNHTVQALLIQRQRPEDVQDVRTRAMQQVALAGGPSPPQVESAITRAHGGGQPVAGAVRGQQGVGREGRATEQRAHTHSPAEALVASARADRWRTGVHRSAGRAPRASWLDAPRYPDASAVPGPWQWARGRVSKRGVLKLQEARVQLRGRAVIQRAPGSVEVKENAVKYAAAGDTVIFPSVSSCMCVLAHLADGKGAVGFHLPQDNDLVDNRLRWLAAKVMAVSHDGKFDNVRVWLPPGVQGWVYHLTDDDEVIVADPPTGCIGLGIQPDDRTTGWWPCPKEAAAAFAKEYFGVDAQGLAGSGDITHVV